MLEVGDQVLASMAGVKTNREYGHLVDLEAHVPDLASEFKDGSKKAPFLDFAASLLFLFAHAPYVVFVNPLCNKKVKKNLTFRLISPRPASKN